MPLKKFPPNGKPLCRIINIGDFQKNQQLEFINQKINEQSEFLRMTLYRLATLKSHQEINPWLKVLSCQLADMGVLPTTEWKCVMRMLEGLSNANVQ